MRHWSIFWCAIATNTHLYSTVIIAPNQVTPADFSVIAQDVKNAYPEPVVLNLSNHGLVEIPIDFFIGLVNIEELYLQQNNLRELPPTILDLQNLQILDCSENQLIEAPEQIGDLSHLKILNFSHNHLKKLPESFKKLTSLQVLGLAHNHFDEIPGFISSLYALTLATLAHNNIKALAPMRILTQLRLLDVSFNNLFNINPSFLPRRMRVLLMNNNLLSDIPSDLLALPELQMLDLSRNPGLYFIGMKAPPTIPVLVVDGAGFDAIRLFIQ